MHKEVTQQTKITAKRMGKPLESNNVYFSTFTQTSSSKNKKIYSVKKSCRQKKIHNFSKKKLEEEKKCFVSTTKKIIGTNMKKLGSQTKTSTI